MLSEDEQLSIVRALAALRQDGWIDTQQGKGSFVRGRPALHVAAAAEAVAALARVAAAHPELAEVEVNPLLVTPAGALGLDARIVLAG